MTGSAAIYTISPVLRELVQIGDRQLGLRLNRWYGRLPGRFTHEDLAVAFSTSEVRVSALGVFRVSIDDVTLQLNHDASRKVLLVLCLSENYSYSREALASMLWPDTTRKKSLANLRQTIFTLKKSFQSAIGNDGPIEADQKTILLANCNVVVDTLDLLQQANQENRNGEGASFPGTQELRFAPEIKTGSDLYLEWLEIRENHFQREIKKVLERLIETANLDVEKLQYANLLSDLAPCNELACRTQMRFYHGNGEKAEALRCYVELWQRLEDEFDVEPASATQELAVAIKIDEGHTQNIELGSQIVLKDDQNGKRLLNRDDLDSPIKKDTKNNMSDPIIPRVAVIPFLGRGVTKEQTIIGEVLADDLINVLSACKTISVISRLSSTVFSGITGNMEAIKLLQVQYLMSGTYRVQGEQITLDVEFSCADTASILWQKRFKGTFSEFVMNEHPFIEEALQGMGVGVMTYELGKSGIKPIEELSNYTLLISAIALMHRLTTESFEKSKKLFEALIERNKNNALPYAYLSHWYALRVGNKWSENPKKDEQVAEQLSLAALDIDPFISLAHTFRGSVNTKFKKDLLTAEGNFTTALEYNPSDSLAWLLRGTIYAFQGQGEDAILNTSKAITLSPFDPHRYFYYSLCGTAALSAGNYEDAIELSKRSLMLNGQHASTLRVLTIALWKASKEDESRKIANRLMEVQPTLTVSNWLRETPCANYPIANEFASVLLRAGVPK